jgi:hypothetical protein
LLAIIAPLSSSSINERLRHFRYPKIKADEPSLMLHPHARVRAEPWQNLGRAVNRPIIDDDDFVCGIDLFKATPDRSACIRCAIKYWIMTETVGPCRPSDAILFVPARPLSGASQPRSTQD